MDYHVGHPAIQPKPYFSEPAIEKGGQGAGTVIRVQLKMFGQEYHYHLAVTEPEPGRILLETDLDTGQFTTFTIDPLNGGVQSRITITSEFPSKPGLMGLMEKLMQPLVICYLSNKEMRQLADYLHSTHTTKTVG